MSERSYAAEREDLVINNANFDGCLRSASVARATASVTRAEHVRDSHPIVTGSMKSAASERGPVDTLMSRASSSCTAGSVKPFAELLAC